MVQETVKLSSTSSPSFAVVNFILFLSLFLSFLIDVQENHSYPQRLSLGHYRNVIQPRPWLDAGPQSCLHGAPPL